MRFVLRTIGGLVLIVVLAVGTIYVLSAMRLERVIAVDDSVPVTLSDSASLARGEHLAGAIAKCEDCHGLDFGGRVLRDQSLFVRVVAPNLTKGRGGLGSTLTDAQIVRAIRHGVAPDGHPLALMPSSDFWIMSDSDVASLVGYVRSRPPVDRELPTTTFGIEGRVLLLAGELGSLFEANAIDHGAARPPAPAAGPTAPYGQYLVRVGGCTGCHGPGLSGGPIPYAPPDAPPARNLTPAGIGTWTEADFARALRTGRRPDGTALKAFMPVQFTRLMTEDEIRAIWAYLLTVPARPTGSR